MNKEIEMDRLIRVIDKLLGPEGCPWDREQTPDSLCDYLIEECFELVSAIRSKDTEEIKEEMGDVFFLVLFIAHLYGKSFSLNDVWNKGADKMILRHPHVFEDREFETREELMQNWEKVKKEEKSGKNDSPFASIPRNLPPLLMAYRINSKAARTGFTWGGNEDVEDKLREEWQEFVDARNSGNFEKAEEEFGDYLFTLVEYGRRNKIKSNTALSIANSKFLDRVEKMESLARSRNQNISELDMKNLDALWDEVKSGE